MCQPEISVPAGMAEFGYHDLAEMSVPAGMREFGYHDLALNLTRFDILRWNSPKTCFQLGQDLGVPPKRD